MRATLATCVDLKIQGHVEHSELVAGTLTLALYMCGNLPPKHTNLCNVLLEEISWIFLVLIPTFSDVVLPSKVVMSAAKLVRLGNWCTHVPELQIKRLRACFLNCPTWRH